MRRHVILRSLLALAVFSSVSGNVSAAPVASGQSLPASPVVDASNVLRAHAIHGVFDELLIPVSKPSKEEFADLTAVIAQYRNGPRLGQVALFDEFLGRWPQTPYRLAILSGTGNKLYRAGYFTSAIDRWTEVWRSRHLADSISVIRPVVDRSIGELIQMRARVGHLAELRQLLDEVSGRPLTGVATELVADARQGLWVMENNPGVAYLCGPLALANALETLKPQDAANLSRLRAHKSGPKGVTLAELSALGKPLEHNWVPVYRGAGTDVPVPSVVHLKINHYTAVVGFDGQRYHLKDPTFGRDLWVTKEALAQEASGFFVLPAERVPASWRVATAAEQSSVYGRGYTGAGTDRATATDDVKAKKNQCDSTGCAQYNVHSMLVSLNIEDTPAAYKPSRGPEIKFKVVYNQRDKGDDAVSAGFSNLGRKWSHEWLSYIQDDPQNSGANVLRFMPGGGSREEVSFNSSTGSYAPSRRDLSVLVKTSSQPIRYEHRMPDGSKLVYAQTNGATSAPRYVLLTEKIDPQGNTVRLHYDTSNRLTRIEDAAGQSTSLDYNAAQSPYLISAVHMPAGISAHFGYNTDGRLESITDAVGLVSSFEYGSSASADFIKAMETPYGRTTFESWEDGIWRRLVVTDPMGLKERFEFRHRDSGVPYSDTVAPPGYLNEHMYWRNSFYWNKRAYELYVQGRDESPDYGKAEISHFLHSGNTTSQTLESTVAYPDRRIWYRYPGQQNTIYEGSSDLPAEVARVLPDGTTQATKYEYNQRGLRTRVVDPVGRDIYFDYADNGLDLLEIRRKVTPSSYKTMLKMTYNAQRLPSSVTDESGKTTTYTYNQYGQVASYTDPLGNATQYAYDSRGYLESIRNASGRVLVSFAHDDAGNVASQTDSEGRTVSYEYDKLNRKIRADYPDGTSESWGYDKLDMARYTNRANATWTYTYNENRELIQVTEPVSAFTTRTLSMTYFPDGTLHTLQDGVGSTTTWERDLRGRVTKKIYANGKGYTQTFDTAGRLESRTDARGQIKRWEYTTDDRIASVKASNAVKATPDVTYVWDAYYPRITSMTDGAGTTAYSYWAAGSNGAGKLQCAEGPWTSVGVCYVYDALGRLSNRYVSTASGSDGSTWRYDALSRVTEERLGQLGVFKYAYRGDTSLVASRLNPNGSEVEFEYGGPSEDHRLEEISHGLNFGRMGGVYKYQSNSLGLVTNAITFNSQGVQNLNESYTYDSLGRLLILNRKLPDAANSGVAYNLYGFDAADNLLQVWSNGNAAADVGSDFLVNALNQATQQDGATLTYDDNGNTLSSHGKVYAWDGHDRLVSAGTAANPNRSQWRYDGLDRRVQATDNGVITRYLWCGDDICAVLDGANKAKAYLYGSRGEFNAGRALLYSEDRLGNVRHVHEAKTGKWLLSLDYEAYGGVRDAACATPADCGMLLNGRLSKGYAGLYWHWPSGLYLAHYRAYDPGVKRWLNRDPIEEEGGLNLYAYVEGDPQNSYDPEGYSGRIPKNFGKDKKMNPVPDPTKKAEEKAARDEGFSEFLKCVFYKNCEAEKAIRDNLVCLRSECVTKDGCRFISDVGGGVSNMYDPDTTICSCVRVGILPGGAKDSRRLPGL
jgi:RHS repeat-associated protein